MRTVFLIDKKGIIRFIDQVEINLVPDNKKLFAELAKLSWNSVLYIKLIELQTFLIVAEYNRTKGI